MSTGLLNHFERKDAGQGRHGSAPTGRERWIRPRRAVLDLHGYTLATHEHAFANGVSPIRQWAPTRKKLRG